MKILNRDSLIETVDAFNEAVFSGKHWLDQARDLVDWTASRLGKPGGYAGSFAMTASDWDREFRLFTGEKVTTRAGRSHVIAQEATRMLAVIAREFMTSLDVVRESEARLGERIFETADSTVASDGMYCCGTCSVAFWRAKLAGAYADYPSPLPAGMKTLKAHRENPSGWRRFPYYYTLLMLLEEGTPLALPEMAFQSEGIMRRIKGLGRKQDPCSRRRLAILERLEAGNG